MFIASIRLDFRGDLANEFDKCVWLIGYPFQQLPTLSCSIARAGQEFQLRAHY